MIPMPFPQPASLKIHHHDGRPHESSALQLMQFPQAQPHTYNSSAHPAPNQSPQCPLALSTENLNNCFRGVSALTEQYVQGTGQKRGPALCRLFLQPWAFIIFCVPCGGCNGQWTVSPLKGTLGARNGENIQTQLLKLGPRHPSSL